MRLLLAGLIFVATALDLKFGSAFNRLDAAALVAASLLAVSVVLDLVWLDPPSSGHEGAAVPSDSGATQSLPQS